VGHISEALLGHSCQAPKYEGAKDAPTPAHIAVVLDASDSMRGSCADDIQAIREAMGSRGIKRSSTLTLIRTGDASTKEEPQLVFAERIPLLNSNDPFGGQRKLKSEASGFFARTEASCNTIARTNHSPIIKGVRRGLAHLKSLGCRRDAGCILIVHSDLQDNDELMSARNRRVVSAPVLDNTGINVVLCGYTETVQDGSAMQMDSLLATWQGLFMEPVKEAPFCSEGLFSETSVSKSGTASPAVRIAGALQPGDAQRIEP
jgi:hypothetical protein